MTSFLSLTTPTNLISEKEKFLSSSTYNPIFHYLWQDKVINLSPKNPKYQLYQAIFNQDYSAITNLASTIFMTELNATILSSAQQDITNRHPHTHSGTAHDFAQLLSEAFDRFKIDYQLEIIPAHGFNARPDHQNHKIIISEAIHYEMFSMAGGVRHDLVHIMRYLNGEFNQIPRDLAYLPTEEGLAAYCQDNVEGVLDNGRTQHALEYLGSYVGSRGSLRDIYNAMRDGGMSSDLAWKRASRHKFGFIDTSLPGDIIKPAMYYFNELKLSKLTSLERLKLFIGKISLDNLDNHLDYRGRWDAEDLISFFNL